MTSKNDHGLVLFGCGLHAKRIYIGYMRSHGIEPFLIVDIAAKKDEITSLVANIGWKNTKLIFIEQKDAYNAFSDTEREYIINIINNCHITKAIISTPPEVHTPYAKLCLEAGIKVLLDKPLSAPRSVSYGNSSGLIDDFKSLLAYDTGDNIIIQCQRRRHDGYRFIKQLIKDVHQDYGIQPHFIDIYHSDGRWDFPDEIPNLTNHPYAFGYGKLLHSGYHFVDLLSYLTDTLDYDQFELFSYKNSINDFKAQIPDKFYKKMFNIDNRYIFPDNVFGEIDSYSLIQLKKDCRVTTTVSMNLLHTGFSRRAWGVAKKDTYKGNGRLRHERVNIQIGPLINIQVHSYQSTEVKGKQTINPHDTGGLEHFDIHIYRNSDLIGGKTYELVRLQDIEKSKSITVGQNENARYQLVDDFLNDIPSGSGIKSHIRTNILLAGIAESISTNEQVSGNFKL